MKDENDDLRAELAKVRQEFVRSEFEQKMNTARLISGIPVLSVELKGADIDNLRQMTDLYRAKNPSGVAAIGSVIGDKPMIICAVTEDLVKRGVNAGDLVRQAAALMGGSGGGRPVLAQAGGKDSSRLGEALESIYRLVEEKLK